MTIKDLFTLMHHWCRNHEGLKGRKWQARLCTTDSDKVIRVDLEVYTRTRMRFISSRMITLERFDSEWAVENMMEMEINGLIRQTLELINEHYQGSEPIFEEDQP